jgi:iron complex outermembrane receptor protein
MIRRMLQLLVLSGVLCAPASTLADTPDGSRIDNWKPTELVPVSGVVTDATTGQPIPNARVSVARFIYERPMTEAKPGPPYVQTVTNNDGIFTMRLRKDRYFVTASRIGYLSHRVVADLPDSVSGPLQLLLMPGAIPVASVDVTTSRATERGSAVAFTDLDRRAVQEKYWAQDVPMLLQETPGVYAYSDAGNGIGYSYVKIRGFPQRRVAVTINGIPLNDPETHEVYWVDHPDLLSSAQSLQVQRGAGSALYGASAVGGAVNLETLTIPAERRIAV